MVIIAYDEQFRGVFLKIKDNKLKEKVIKQIQKLRENPEVGKPMKYGRKGTRELYVLPFRLSYTYIKNGDKIVLLDLYHKDKQ